MQEMQKRGKANKKDVYSVFKKVGKLIAEYDDADPLSLLRAIGVKIFLLPMEGISGIYKTIHKIPMVFIDNNLSEEQICFVAAHELGHVVLHGELNRFFMDKCTLIRSSIYEQQADLFAVCLLHPSPDDVIEDGDSFERLSHKLGVSVELAKAYYFETLK